MEATNIRRRVVAVVCGEIHANIGKGKTDGQLANSAGPSNKTLIGSGIRSRRKPDEFMSVHPV
jgi:hypothetical protein